jgi:hypothetical protein
MVTSAKYDGAFYKTPQTTESTLILFRKPIVYERLVLKLSKNIVFKKFNFSYFFPYRATLARTHASKFTNEDCKYFVSKLLYYIENITIFLPGCYSVIPDVSSSLKGIVLPSNTHFYRRQK